MAEERVSGLAVILKVTPLRESDLCLELFSEQVGRARVVARGALKSQRRYMGALELGALIKVDYRPKLNGLATLGPCDVVSSPWRARADLQRLATLYYALELTLRCAPLDDPDPALFESLVALLEQLEGPQPPSALELIAWELALLDHLGYELRIDRCPFTGLAPNALSFKEGGALHTSAQRPCSPVPTEALRLLYRLRQRRRQGRDALELSATAEELHALRLAFGRLWSELTHHPIKSHAFLLEVSVSAKGDAPVISPPSPSTDKGRLA